MNLTKSKIFLIFCLSFIVGVFAGRHLNYETMAILAMVFIILGTLWYRNITLAVISLAGLLALAGAWRFQTSYRQNDLKEFYGREAAAEGVILAEPDRRSDKTYLTIGKLVMDGRELKSKVLLTTGRFPEYDYGQRIAFTAQVAEPAEFEEFSYKNYLSRLGIDAVAYYPKIEVQSAKEASDIKFYLLKFKKIFVEKLNQSLPEPQSSLLAGLLVGERKSMPADLVEALSVTGTTHVVAISGFNITIIATAVNNLLLFFFRRKISFLIALAAIILFVLLTGAQSSAVRAGIMGILGMLALNFGRISSINNALALTAAGMLAFNPQISYFDVGFQLSFVALLGLVYAGPIFDKLLKRIPKWIRFYLVPTIAAYVATLPILLFNFDRLSLISVPVNFLVLPMIPAAMLFGFLAGSLALAFEVIALPFVWLAWGSLSYVLWIIGRSAEIPLAAVEWHLGLFWMLAAYAALIGMVYLWTIKQNNYSDT